MALSSQTSASAIAENKLVAIALVVVCGSWYIGSSAGLIAFNKYLVTADRFPFPAALGLLHASFCSLMAGVLFLVKPQLFPAMTDPEKKVTVDRSLVRSIALIAILFAAQIILSNYAYLFADVAFLQMLKESNLVLVYLMSVAFAIEAFKWRQVGLVVFIVMATCITVEGELKFSLPGFLMQATSCLGESLKLTLQCLLLSSMGRGLDTLSYMLLVMPVCALIFGSIIGLSSYFAPHQQILPMPSLHDWMQWKWMLLANACSALMLNVSTLVFIRVSSAVAFVLAGVIKDVMIVVVGVVAMGHQCSTVQASGFSLQVALVFLWSLLKTFPKEFESGIGSGLLLVLIGKTPESKCLLEAAPDDKKPIKDVEYGSNTDESDKSDTWTTCSDKKTVKDMESGSNVKE